MKRISIIGIEVINNEISEKISIFEFHKKLIVESLKKLQKAIKKNILYYKGD